MERPRLYIKRSRLCIQGPNRIKKMHLLDVGMIQLYVMNVNYNKIEGPTSTDTRVGWKQERIFMKKVK